MIANVQYICNARKHRRSVAIYDCLLNSNKLHVHTLTLCITCTVPQPLLSTSLQLSCSARCVNVYPSACHKHHDESATAPYARYPDVARQSERPPSYSIRTPAAIALWLCAAHELDPALRRHAPPSCVRHPRGSIAANPSVLPVMQRNTRPCSAEESALNVIHCS
jgi:hypothetical protein